MPQINSQCLAKQCWLRLAASITHTWFRERYFAISQNDCGYELNEDDFGYTWQWFQQVRRLYQKAAVTNRAVIFTVDC